ncbi:hypothetical protein ACS0TY_030140 [Phlomoides rotata]
MYPRALELSWACDVLPNAFRPKITPLSWANLADQTGAKSGKTTYLGQMEHSSQQSNGFGFGSGTGVGVSKKGSGGTRRVWAQHEEKVLMDALKDLVVKGQKSDNGFRTGYLTKLEIALRKAFPGTDL